MKIEPKTYKGKYVPGTLQFGKSSKGNEQIAVDLSLEGGHVVSTFMSFSDAARPYSEERLIALGWGGKGKPLNDETLSNEVDVVVSYRMYEGKEQMDVQIATGSGRVKMKEQMSEAEKSSFLQRLTGAAPNAQSKVPF